MFDPILQKLRIRVHLLQDVLLHQDGDYRVLLLLDERRPELFQLREAELLLDALGGFSRRFGAFPIGRFVRVGNFEVVADL